MEKSGLNTARTELLEKLFQKDTASVNTYIKNYQIDALDGFLASDFGIPIRVRLAEFIYPLREKLTNNKDEFYPDLKNSYNAAFPVLNREDGSTRPVKATFNAASLRKFGGEVFILSGRHDHVADYRSSIYLDGLMKNSNLFLVDDDHTFKRLKSNNDYAAIIQDFFKLNGETVISHYANYRWFEE